MERAGVCVWSSLASAKALGQERSRQGEQGPDQAGPGGWGECIWILILSLLGESMNLKGVSTGAAFGLSGQRQQRLEVDARSPGSAVCAQARSCPLWASFSWPTREEG